MILNRRSMLAGIAVSAALPRIARAATPPVVRNSIALDEGRVWIAAKVEGHGPYLFIVDTGATFSLIDDDLAKSLRLKENGTTRLRGVGGVSESTFWIADEVSFASGVRFEKMQFSGTKARLGRDAVGSMGSGLFTTYDSDLDFVKGEWRAYPQGRGDFDELTRIASRFDGRDISGDRIFADATIGDFSGEFLLDTGAPAVASLTGRAVAKSGLWSDDRPYAPMARRGIGRGSVPSRIVRADRLMLGPLTWKGPLVVVQQPGQPSGRGDGAIGLPVLELMNLTTQAKTRSLWVSGNGRQARDRSYAYSGLWFEREGDATLVADVGTGSPAKAAGMRVGDRVIGEQWGALLVKSNAPPGRDIALTIDRDGKRRDVRFKTAAYL